MNFNRLVVVVVAVASSAFAQFNGQTVAARKSRPADFALVVERRELRNGLVLLMSPDDGANDVAVELSFGCGALRQAPDRAGLPHLVEHALASGPTPETDYQRLLEARGATDFNGFTTMDRMGFTGVVPPEELPFALWVHADRLGRRERLITPADLDRHRRIVLQEKLLRIEDASYGAASRMMFRYLFSKRHPLHEGIIGTAATLEAITVDDAVAFARTCLVPNNAVLALAGRFEVEQAVRAAEATLGRIPVGAPLEPVPETPRLAQGRSAEVVEDVARKPQVTMAWWLPMVRKDDAYTLSLGATLLEVYTDGLIGMRVESAFVPNGVGGIFALSVTTPHPLGATEPASNAEVVLRNLTYAPLPADVVAASYHMLDLQLLAGLSSMAQRAGLISQLYQQVEGAHTLPPLDRHWRLSPEQLFAGSSPLLKGAHVVLESKPVRPLPPPRRRR
ncbi:MAG: insulinase family protein [Myxococcaceae bacterium]|nr:insulinase family protein [Myxococcaceae bacterium]